jgi:hypothetical protein
MQDCRHLNIQEPEQVTPNLIAPAVPLCALKINNAVMIQMALDAAAILPIVCPPNPECHYFALDRCEDCPDYSV